MKIVIAPDSFKGSLSSIEAINIIRDEALNCFTDAEIVGVPLADGGEGTIEAALFESGGEIRKHCVRDPLGNMIEAKYGIIGDTAIIEMALCSGLTLVPIDNRNPLKTSSYGTGQMIRHVMEEGIQKILLGIGGSATNDGGIGAMQALGVELFDKNNILIKNGCGEALINIDRIDTANIDRRLKNCKISVMCDVINPLTGKNGATYVYATQKGGSEESIESLERGMLNYELKLNELVGKEVSKQKGAGAAGGMGAALLGFCDAKLVSGIDAILELKAFEEKIKDADLIITGEGRVDKQSSFGKVITGVTTYAKKEGVPVIVIAGGVGDGFESVYDLGVEAIFTLPNRPMSLSECMKEADSLLKQVSRNIFATIKQYTRT